MERGGHKSSPTSAAFPTEAIVIGLLISDNDELRSAIRGTGLRSDLRAAPTPPQPPPPLKKIALFCPISHFPPQNNDAKPSQRALRSDGGAEVARIADGGGGGGGGGVAGGAAFGGFWSPFRSTAESGERPKRTARLRPHSAQRRSSIWVSLGFFFFNCFFFFPDFFPLDFIFSRFFRFLVFTPFLKNTALISFSFFPLFYCFLFLSFFSSPSFFNIFCFSFLLFSLFSINFNIFHFLFFAF